MIFKWVRDPDLLGIKPRSQAELQDIIKDFLDPKMTQPHLYKNLEIFLVSIILDCLTYINLSDRKIQGMPQNGFK